MNVIAGSSRDGNQPWFASNCKRALVFLQLVIDQVRRDTEHHLLSYLLTLAIRKLRIYDSDAADAVRSQYFDELKRFLGEAIARFPELSQGKDPHDVCQLVYEALPLGDRMAPPGLGHGILPELPDKMWISMKCNSYSG